MSDILDRLKKENILNKENYFLIEKVSSNHLIFGIVQQRYTPSEIHEFKYNRDTQEMEISSKYGKGIYTVLMILLFPLLLFLGKPTGYQLITAISCFTIVLIYALILIKYNLKEHSKGIERDLLLRINRPLK